MTKGIFVLEKLNKEKIEKIIELGANLVFVGHKNLEKELIRRLKNKNAQVYAEIGLFVGEELWQKYPDARPVDRDGKPIGKIDWYGGICPNHPQIRKEKFQVIKTLIDNNNIDGIWLDFIRYPCHWEEVRNSNIEEYCFCSICLDKFKQEIGGEPKGEKWIQWKCDQITNFVAEAKSLIDQSGKKVQLGMFSIPWRETDFNNSVRKVIGQDFKRLAKHIDIFSPMVYHQMCERQVRWIHKMVVYMKRITGKKILPIVQTEDKPKKISEEEFKREIELANEEPSQGAIIFFLEDLLRDKNKLAVVKEIF